jgi:PTH1 family peptidyl-tRNA hydrolase
MVSLIVGLGNPGERYKNTRHNLGYRVVDFLSNRFGRFDPSTLLGTVSLSNRSLTASKLTTRRDKKEFKPGKGEFLFCENELRGEKIYLVKPLTFMNSSGVAVAEAIDNFNLGIENLLVVCDDVALPLGKIRIREKGTDGGHKGLRSIIYQLNSMDFARLRMGIGDTSDDVDLEEFVLEDFKPEEKEKVDQMIEKAALAVENVVINGIEDSMNRFNV